jgi:GcrA cell cycle regulator
MSAEFWTDDRIHFLRETWGHEGWTATSIAEEIGSGCSRNAVIGKAQRLGLSKPVAAEVARRRAQAKARTHRAQPPASEPAAPLPPPIEPVVAPSRGGIPLLALRDRSCRFPLWSDRERSGLYCGAETTSPKSSYSAACERRVYTARGLEKLGRAA